MGRRPHIQWPEGARIAVVPSVALETWPPDLGTADSLQNEARRPIPRTAPYPRDLNSVTDRQYGERVGVYRLLELFQREGINTTFFVNGMNALRTPDLIREIHRQGHEVGTESLIHNYSFMKTPDQEREDLDKTVAAVVQALGQPPRGFLSSGVRPTEATPGLLAEAGYLYWADLQHDELPYTLRVKGKDLVALTYFQYLNDYTTFSGHEKSPRDLLQIWKDTFDYLYREGETHPAMMIWGVHPFLSGRPYRAIILEEFIRYAKGFPRVWFARCLDIAQWWRSNFSEAWVEDWPNFYGPLQA